MVTSYYYMMTKEGNCPSIQIAYSGTRGIHHVLATQTSCRAHIKQQWFLMISLYFLGNSVGP